MFFASEVAENGEVGHVSSAREKLNSEWWNSRFVSSPWRRRLFWATAPGQDGRGIKPQRNSKRAAIGRLNRLSPPPAWIS